MATGTDSLRIEECLCLPVLYAISHKPFALLP